MRHYDFVIVGGGLVGCAIAYGLALCGHRVAVVDEGDVAYRASRGNFGLVWVQGKGMDMPCYSDWSQKSASLWTNFAADLREMTGVDVHYERRGGVHICSTDEELQERRDTLDRLSAQTEGRFRFEMLDHRALAELIPAIGDDVAGASWCIMDGHADPLKLLRGLQTGLQICGGAYLPGMSVRRIARDRNGYRVEGEGKTAHGDRLVLAAGLGNSALAPQVGLDVPLTPNRGQVLITERTVPLLDLPTAYARQTADGTIQLGDSHEDVGMNDGTCTGVLSDIARRTLRHFPGLKSTRVIRAWGCLRIMTPDGFPIYEESPAYPGVFVACCHSGVTLAAVHAQCLAPWIAGGDRPKEIVALTGERFDVPTLASG